MKKHDCPFCGADNNETICRICERSFEQAIKDTKDWTEKYMTKQLVAGGK